jgi:hypothetical protein
LAATELTTPPVTTLITVMTSGIHWEFNKNQLFRSKTIYPDSHPHRAGSTVKFFKGE